MARSYSAKNISSTTDPFTLEGGRYVMETNATSNTGSITLQKLSIDEVTWLVALTAVTSTSNMAPGDLPEGTYRVAIVTATGVYINLNRLPRQ